MKPILTVKGSAFGIFLHAGRFLEPNYPVNIE